jgi:RHS repeat-associated protein
MAYADGSRMSGYRAPGAAAETTFAYDALGRTAKRTDPAGTTETYDFVGASETIWRSTPSAGSVTTSLVDPAGGRLSVTQGSATGWTLFDQLGSVAALVDSTSGLAATYRFDGWGNALTSLNPSANPYGFRGSVNLGTDSVPLYEMGARFYAPSVGVFSQLDTYAGTTTDPFSLNRFLYAHANPTSLVDPDGHSACSAYADYCSVNGSTTAHTVQHHDSSGRRIANRGRRTTNQVLGDSRTRSRTASRYGEGGQYGDPDPRLKKKVEYIQDRLRYARQLGEGGPFGDDRVDLPVELHRWNGALNDAREDASQRSLGGDLEPYWVPWRLG